MSYTYSPPKQPSFHGCRPHELKTSRYPPLHFCLLLPKIQVFNFFEHRRTPPPPKLYFYFKSYFSLCVHVLQSQTIHKNKINNQCILIFKTRPSSITLGSTLLVPGTFVVYMYPKSKNILTLTLTSDI